jgi:2-dehydropantoate 2-reductase
MGNIKIVGCHEGVNLMKTDLVNQRLFILGGGAIGMALVVHLEQQGHDVILVRTSKNDIAEEEITISMETVTGEIIKTKSKMTSLDSLKELNGIAVVTAKSYGNEVIAAELNKKRIQSPIVVMQNGLGVERPYLDAGFSEVYRCVLFSTSQKMGEYNIRFIPVTVSPIGIIRGNIQSLGRIVESLNTPGFQFSVEANIHEKIWQKTILNSVFNSICPILEVDNGIFHRDDEVTQVALEIMGECISVASVVGITLDIDQLQQQMLAISKVADSQFISTLVDIRNNRETEIDSLNLEIARIAEKQEPIIPIDKTKLLGKMILLKSRLSGTEDNL